MDQATKNIILQAIESDRLVILCGAGLSMAPPSSLPSASVLAEDCFNRHRNSVDPNVDPALKNDLEALAGHFAADGSLVRYFIRTLVPWAKFSSRSNAGHLALSDMLLVRAVFSILSTNYDALIETPAKADGEDVQVALSGDEADIQRRFHAPLLKIHGCSSDRDHTVWHDSQLQGDPQIAWRIQNISAWMNVNLREKDLLLIGFWSDWAYLNQIIDSAFENVSPNSVTVVDPSEPSTLEEKAPVLWAKAHAPNVTFTHVQQSGADALDFIRREFSRAYIRKLLASGANAFVHEYGVNCEDALLDCPDLATDELVQWRRDAEGIGFVKWPRLKSPIQGEMLGFVHLMLRSAGAVIAGNRYEFQGRSVRVVHGAQWKISTMKERFETPPAANSDDMIICVGSYDNGLPDNAVREGEPGSIVRPTAKSNFLTVDDARAELGI